MNNEMLMDAQRQLRRSLLDHTSTIRWRPTRDLAAHLLLHLDDPADCWRLAARWVREAFDADRVDCGFGGPDDTWYRPQAEALRDDRAVPSVIGLPIDASDCGVQTVWHSHGVVVLRDVAQERLLGRAARADLLRMGTRVKMAAPILDRARPLGLMCVDWMDACEPARDERWARFEEVATVVLGPVMSISQRMAERVRHRAPWVESEYAADPLDCLTPAERTVAQLAVGGLSYKEIARQLNRSFSTVDHQLRSARNKLGVNSTARLVNLMSGRPSR